MNYLKYLVFTTTSLLLLSCASKKKEVATVIKPFTFEKIATLPKVINESSGLITLNGNLITINDSGGGAVIYELDTGGTLMQQHSYSYLQNIDWESITQSDRYIHIADVGNNRGNRKDLKVYNIMKDQIWNTDLEMDISGISYTQQTDFKQRNQNHPYDAEATQVIDNQFYLFSKDWVNFTTTIYKTVLFTDASLTAQQTIDVNGLITGASFNGTSTVILCGYDQSLQPFIARLSYDSGTFKLINRHELPISGAQIEAITYYSTDADGNDIYYLTSEAVNVKLGDDEASTAGELYKLTLKN